VVEGTATNAAAGVAEGAAKPESTLGYTETTEAIRKIATVLPISDEMLEDAPSIQTYLNGRLTLFVRVEEERQLLRGAGAASNELLGIMGAGRGINTYTKLAADDNAVALAKVIANTAGSAFVQPDTVILHPSNWLTTRLLRRHRRHRRPVLRRRPVHRRLRQQRRRGDVRPAALEHPRGAVQLRWRRDGAGRQLRPVGAYLAAVGRDGRSDKQSLRFLCPKSDDAEGRGAARARRVQAGRLRGGARTHLRPENLRFR
jgi:hypothetical protein